MEKVNYILLEAESGGSNSEPGVFTVIRSVDLKDDQSIKDAMDCVIGKNIAEFILGMCYDDEYDSFNADIRNYNDFTRLFNAKVFNDPYAVIYVDMYGNMQKHTTNKNSAMKYAFQEIQKQKLELKGITLKEEYGFSDNQPEEFVRVASRNYIELVTKDVVDAVNIEFDGEKFQDGIRSIVTDVYNYRFAHNKSSIQRVTFEKFLNDCLTDIIVANLGCDLSKEDDQINLFVDLFKSSLMHHTRLVSKRLLEHEIKVR